MITAEQNILHVISATNEGVYLRESTLLFKAVLTSSQD
jgi:hypothetical protein